MNPPSGREKPVTEAFGPIEGANRSTSIRSQRGAALPTDVIHHLDRLGTLNALAVFA
jgi:hypothetical protein